MDESYWLKLLQILSGVATPIMVAVLGIFLVRHIEGIKAETTKQSAFHVRWADEFFEACQSFLRALEREIAILTFLMGRGDKNDNEGIELQHEQGKLHLLAYEQKLRIRRLSVFSPIHANKVSELSDSCFSSVHNAMSGGKVHSDPIFQVINEFNRYARLAHAEMLALDRAKPEKPA